MPENGEIEGLDQAFANQVAGALSGQKVLNRLGLGGIRLVKDRTRKGKNVRGQRFEPAPSAEPGSPYSPGHRRKREKQGEPTGRINFVFDHYDGMMQKVNHVVSNDLEDVAIIIDDEDKRQIASYHNTGAGNLPKRRFWAFNSDDTQKLSALATDQIEKDLTDLLASL